MKVNANSRNWLAALLTALGASLASAQEAPVERGKLAALVASVQRESGVPALGGARFDAKGKASFGVAGVRRAGHEDPVRLEDAWHLGSCTKTLTAALAARLVEEDSLSFETKLGPTLRPKEGDAEFGPAAKATLKQLLHHRSGLPANFPFAVHRAEMAKRPHAITGEARRERVLAMLDPDSGREPGGDPLYSNAGYTAVGSLCEAVTGRPYRELLTTRVLEPLGVSTPHFGPPDHALGAENAICGHRRKGDSWVPAPGADNPALITPAGRLALSLADWVRTLQPWLRVDEKATGLPSPAMRKRLTTPAEGSRFASGWVVTERPWAGGEVWTHSGSNTLWYAVVWLAPEKGFGVVATANAGGRAGARATDTLVARLIKSREPR